MAVAAANPRPLTIGRHHRGIYRVGNTIVAPGGFGAQGYGYPVATPEEREEVRNTVIRQGSTGIYENGVDGFGGLGFDDDQASGYDNPYYGNTFNGYTGYNGLPTHLAFGPGFANRYNTDRDPDADEGDGPPSPAALGYRTGRTDDDE